MKYVREVQNLLKYIAVRGGEIKLQGTPIHFNGIALGHSQDVTVTLFALVLCFAVYKRRIVEVSDEGNCVVGVLCLVAVFFE